MNKVRVYSDDFELSGYLNVKVDELDNLESKYNIDQGELDELILDNAMDHVPLEKAGDRLLALSKLIKRGGIIIVQGCDLYEVCKAFASYHIDVDETNKILFGKDKKLSFTAISMSNFLEQTCQLKVLKKRVSSYTYSIEAQR